MTSDNKSSFQKVDGESSPEAPEASVPASGVSRLLRVGVLVFLVLVGILLRTGNIRSLVEILGVTAVVSAWYFASELQKMRTVSALCALAVLQVAWVALRGGNRAGLAMFLVSTAVTWLIWEWSDLRRRVSAGE